MYAIVEIAGQQFKVEKGKKIFVHRLDSAPDMNIEFDNVLLVEDNDLVLVGEPKVKDYVVEGKVIANVRGDKVIVFKKKRKKGYRVKNGHRQNFTQIEIINIGEKGAILKQAPEKEADKTAATKITEVVLTEKKAPPKKSPAKKPAAKKETEEIKTKKPAVKKEAVKKPAARKTSKSKE